MKMLSPLPSIAHLRKVCATLVTLSTINLHLAVLGQGSLTPPGPPAPTMKTLGEVEPRKPISSAPYTITNAGSYYLTTNLVGTSGQSGVITSSGNVTFDLNGFALLGMPGSADGIQLSSGYTNIVIRNGTITAWGGRGVNAQTAPPPHNLVLEKLNVCANVNVGIQYNSGTPTVVVRDCMVQSNAQLGVYGLGSSLISGCVVSDNGGNGITAYSSIVKDCLVFNNGSSGIAVSPGTVSGCFVHHNGFSGISSGADGSRIVDNHCVTNNTVDSTQAAGIFVTSNGNLIEHNHVTGSGNAGILVYLSNNTNNIIIRNTVMGTGVRNIVTNNPLNAVGSIITTLGPISSSNPWANLSY